MSIKAHLSALEDDGRVTSFRAPTPHSSKRALYLTATLAEELKNPTSNVNYHKAASDCERMMERWVAGEPMKVKLGGAGRGAMLARLDPPPSDVWELRITDPSPQFRIFCQFVAPDILLATYVENRAVLGERNRGRKRSQAWSNAMYSCANEVAELIAPHGSFTAGTIEEYVTENYYAL